MWLIFTSFTSPYAPFKVSGETQGFFGPDPDNYTDQATQTLQVLPAILSV